MAWYPGSESRADAFKHAGVGVEELGQPLQNGQSASAPSTYIPWLFRAGLSPAEVAPCAMCYQSCSDSHSSSHLHPLALQSRPVAGRGGALCLVVGKHSLADSSTFRSLGANEAMDRCQLYRV